jgi:hypothetical protein
MNRTLDETANAAFHTQSLWLSGNLTRFELVDAFVEELLPLHDESVTSNLDRFLPRLNVLVTTGRDGYRVIQSNSRAELKDVLLKTTWVYVVLTDCNECGYMLDGYTVFSRPCPLHVAVPMLPAGDFFPMNMTSTTTEVSLDSFTQNVSTDWTCR